ncbi:MAG: hypothetical protein AB1714_00030 [Acidobacteriota bacterium]
MPSEILERLKAGEVPPPVVELIARGAFPLPPEESIEAQLFLLQSQDPKIQEAAKQALEAQPQGAVLGLLSSPEVDLAVVYFYSEYAERAKKPAYLEAVIKNPSTPDDYIAFLAARLPPNLLDIITTNQMRLIRAPQIMDAIEMNPQISRDILRRVREVREEFFVKKAAEASTVQVGAGPVGLVKYGDKEVAPAAGTLRGEALARVLPQEVLASLEPDEQAEGLTPERVSVYQKLFRMSVPERVQVGLKGTREERSILVKDPNKVVVDAVLSSPKLTESEVETFSSMRNLTEEILKRIASSREWVKNYKIVQNLVLNPKTPVAVSLGFMARLQEKDVYNLSRNKNIPDVIRKAAARLIVTRRERGH